MDTDRSGHISLEEFTFLHQKIVKGAQEIALKQASAQRKIEQGEQRAKFLKASVAVLLIGLVLMLAGNAGLTAAVVFLSKDTAVDDSGASTTSPCQPCFRDDLSTPTTTLSPSHAFSLRPYPPLIPCAFCCLSESPPPSPQGRLNDARGRPSAL